MTTEERQFYDLYDTKLLANQKAIYQAVLIEEYETAARAKDIIEINKMKFIESLKKVGFYKKGESERILELKEKQAIKLVELLNNELKKHIDNNEPK